VRAGVSRQRVFARPYAGSEGLEFAPSPARRIHAATEARLSDDDLLAIESRVCSYGDTVHYAERPAIFERCEGSYLFDRAGRPYLDLQMWYSAVNLGYANRA